MTQRHRVQLAIVGVVLLVGGALFVRFFPSVWGEVLYPLPPEYAGYIRDAAQKYGCDDANQLAAIMYIESGMNPNARSSAGATGLMQIMPGTADGIAKKLGMTDYNYSKLTEPKLNIEMGAYKFCTELRERGSVEATLISYNAGPAVAGAWQEGNRAALPRETSGYIRKFQGVYLAYTRTYGMGWTGQGADFATAFQAQKKQNLENFLDSFFGIFIPKGEPFGLKNK